MAKKRGKKKISDRSYKELKNQLVRALADYDNLRKRVEREREEFGKLANLTLVARLLPVYDMLEGAQKHLADSGLAITIEEFKKVLKDEGIERIRVKIGDKFDEEVHEAVEVEDPPAGGSGKEGKITKLILSGWRVVDGPIIRPVKVKVGKKGK